MPTAPHPALRRLWVEAAAPANAMRVLGCLQDAWMDLVSSLPELSILNSEQFLEPLLEFSAFDTSIDQAITRYSAEHDSAKQAGPSAVPRPYAAQSVKRERPKRNSVSSDRNESLQHVRGSSGPAEIPASQRARAVSETIRRVEATKRIERHNRVDPGAKQDRVDPGAERARIDRHPAKEIKVGSSPVISLPSELPQRSTELESVAVAAASLDRAGVTATATNGLVSKSSLLAPASVRSNPPASVSAETTFRDRRETREIIVRRVDVFDQVLGPAIERLTRRPRTVVTKVESAAQASVQPENNLGAQPDHNDKWNRVRRSALQRFAARASRTIYGTEQEHTRPATEPELATFAQANRISDREAAHFDSQLTTVLRQEMLRHGISLEGLEQ